MTDKKPNQGKKKGNKPGLSSSTGKSEKTQAPGKSDSQSTKPAASAAATTAAAETKRAVAPTNTAGASTVGTTHKTTTVQEKKSNGWIAPVALLFGLVGTGFSAYLYSKLNSLSETTTSSLQSTAEATKTEIAGVRTALDEKAAALTTTLEEKTAGLSGILEEKTGSLSATLDEKTGSLSETLATTSEAIRSEAASDKVEIATSTASAVQELTTKTETEINNVSTSFNTGLALLRERNSEKFTEFDTRLTELDESVKTTNELAMRGQRDWVLAEVNYLLRTGVHRVKLAGDVKAGVIALESASDRLHTLGDINYLPVREQVAEEVAALRRVGPPDIEGLIFKIQHMSKRADTLPLPPTGTQKVKAAMAEDAPAATKALGQSILDRLKGSVVIGPSDGAAGSAKRTRKTKPTKDQLTASDSLRLHLQAARLSALRHDANNFSTHMDNSIKYSNEIFDTDSDQVKTFIADLMDIKETNIVPKVPLLGSSLSLFTKIDAKRGEN